MRFVLLILLGVTGSGCITGALHDAAFPEGYEYEFPLDANSAAASGQGFRICFSSRTGPVEIDLQPAASDMPATFALPLAAVSTSGESVWKGSSARVRACTMQGVSGNELPVGSLLFSAHAASIPGHERRSAASTTALPAQIVPLSVQISGDRKRLRIVTQAGETILRSASYGEFDPGFAPYDEDQWIVETGQAAQNKWEPLQVLDQKALNVYYRRGDGTFRLKAFPLAMPENAVVYVPHLSERQKENRYYLLPLYPFAVLLDGLTVVLQGAIWYEDARKGTACLR